MIRVTDGGLCTTVQDRGRVGYMKLGITACGAMDERSYEIANALVGNRGGEAALEATLTGPALELEGACVFAVTGGDLQPRLNEKPIPMYRAISAKAGDRLTFAGRRSGCRAYIAFRGGVDVPTVLSSRSTDSRAKIGGWQGRVLRAGDVLPLGRGGGGSGAAPVPPEDFSGKRKVLRVLPGPQWDYFAGEGLRTFFASAYTVTPKCDRMGCHLSGKAVAAAAGSDIITDGICMGAVQIPADGMPIVMLADRQPTGGYAKIANVISVDLPLAAQLIPGDTVEFREVTVREAQLLLRQQTQRLRQLYRGGDRPRRYRATVDGQLFEIGLELMEETEG